jgi:FAD/FMN-containing dehydrogenase
MPGGPAAPSFAGMNEPTEHAATIDPTPTHLAAALAEQLTGEVIAPHHPDYETARRVWNRMIDKRPAVIARCADADDVASAVRFAAEHGLPLAVRGGGHNFAGTAVVDDGLVVDLSAMRGVHVDPEGGTVRVEGGATWADVDQFTAPLGLATPAGWCPKRVWPASPSAAASPTSAGATG